MTRIDSKIELTEESRARVHPSYIAWTYGSVRMSKLYTHIKAGFELLLVLNLGRAC